MAVESHAALHRNSSVGGLGKCQRRHHHASAGHSAQFEDIASTFFHFYFAPGNGDTSGVTGERPVREFRRSCLSALEWRFLVVFCQRCFRKRQNCE
jgi:hypothetical protein